VKYEQPKPDEFETNILRHQGFFNYSAHWFATHGGKLAAGWSPDESVLNGFHDYLMKDGVTFTEADWTRDHDWIRSQLKTEMYIAGFSYEDSLKVNVEQDPEVAKAIAAMPQASDLLAQSKGRFEKQRASR